jgi:hypothetical protein
VLEQGSRASGNQVAYIGRMSGRGPDGVYDDGTVAVWLERPNLLLTQVRSSRYTVEQAKTFVGTIIPRTRKTLTTDKLIWVSDSRAINNYEGGSRTILTDWCIEHKRELDRIIIVASPRHKLTLMGLRVATVGAALAGIRMQVLTSLDELRVERIVWPGDDSTIAEHGTI